MELSNSNGLIGAMRAYVSVYPAIGEIDLLHIDRIDEEPQSYAVTASGLVKLSESVTGKQRWQYNAVLESREYTADDLSRLNASLFTENIIMWVEKQNAAEKFPELPEGMTPQRIYADNGMLLSVDDDGDRGIYQIQIHLIYTKRNSDRR